MAVETPSGTVDGVNATFTASSDLVANHQLYVDRLLQVQTTDYTYSGRTITFLSGAIPQTGALLRLYNGVAGLPLAGSSGSDSWQTSATIISDAYVELGLGTADLSDPYASTDQNVVLLCRLLKSLGRELVKHRKWTHLQKEYTLTTENGTASYALPSDFRDMADSTWWNRTQQLPLIGPTSQQDWQYLQARTGSIVLSKAFRIVNGRISFYPTPSAAETFAFEYISRYWVKPSGQSSPTSETPSAYTDTLCFDPLLLLHGLKYKFLKAKGFPEAGAALAEYNDTLSSVAGEDNAAPVLRLGGNAFDGLLGEANIPLTGFGS